MPDSPSSNDTTQDLLKSLQLVTTLMNNLLSDIKEHSTALALVKAKVESLTENVETLSHVVRDGNGQGSMMTRLALAEKELENLEEEIHAFQGNCNIRCGDIKSIIEKEKAKKETEDAEEKKYRREKKISKWQIIGGVAAGVLALVLQVLQIIFN